MSNDDSTPAGPAVEYKDVWYLQPGDYVSMPEDCYLKTKRTESGETLHVVVFKDKTVEETAGDG